LLTLSSILIPDDIQRIIELIDDILFTVSNYVTRIDSIKVIEQSIQNYKITLSEDQRRLFSIILSRSIKYDPHHTVRKRALECFLNNQCLLSSNEFVEIVVLKCRDKDTKIRLLAYNQLESIGFDKLQNIISFDKFRHIIESGLNEEKCPEIRKLCSKNLTHLIITNATPMAVMSKFDVSRPVYQSYLQHNAQQLYDVLLEN